MVPDAPFVTYNYTAHQAAAGFVALGQTQPSRPFEGYAVPAGFDIFLIVLFALRGDAGQTGVWSTVGVVGVAAGAYAYASRNSVRLCGWFARRGWRRLELPPSIRASVSLSEDGLQFEAGPNGSSLAWSAVRQVARGHGVIVVAKRRTAPWVVIPESAFESESEPAAFVGFKEERTRLSRGLPNR